MGAGSKVYESFMNTGSPSTWNVDKCNDNFCPNFFRHPILDFWKQLPIDEVKLVIYKNQTAVVTMVFNGRKTNLSSWFSHANLKSSPWDDLSSVAPQYFLINGRATRRFYIANDNGCDRDSGWLILNEGPFQCPHDVTKHYPAIRYSNTTSQVVWRNG
uniref:Uncharacterized protein n=1 Tax=Octopus bimaculoides TaxID=37653 RepID=A0A0L8FJM7_OCTBM